MSPSKFLLFIIIKKKYILWFKLVPFAVNSQSCCFYWKNMLTFAVKMKKDKPEYEAIRQMVEDVTGQKIQTPKDFDLLALRIHDRTNILLSVSTLKRFWGYVAKNDETRGEMRKSSLNALAIYVGFADWEAFCNRQKTDNANDGSNFFYGHKQTTTDHMQPGDTLIVMWKPNRMISLRYSGNDVWMVTESRNSKLSVGDTFKCHVFVEHQPLVLVDLVHDGLPPCGYICGKNGGITFQTPKGQ